MKSSIKSKLFGLNLILATLEESETDSKTTWRVLTDSGKIVAILEIKYDSTKSIVSNLQFSGQFTNLMHKSLDGTETILVHHFFSVLDDLQSSPDFVERLFNIVSKNIFMGTEGNKIY
jgi:hypothetical protein